MTPAEIYHLFLRIRDAAMPERHARMQSPRLVRAARRVVERPSSLGSVDIIAPSSGAVALGNLSS